MSAILGTKDLTVRYGDVVALEAVDVEIPRGASIAVLGPNGSGKSTLFSAAVGLSAPSAGEVTLGTDRIAYLPQQIAVVPMFPATVRDVVAMGRWGALGWRRRMSDRDRELVADAMRALAVDHLARRRLGELSGGQRQRTLLAQVAAQDAELLLLDEPFTGVDKPTEDTVRVADPHVARRGPNRHGGHARPGARGARLRPRAGAQPARDRSRSCRRHLHRGGAGRDLRRPRRTRGRATDRDRAPAPGGGLMESLFFEPFEADFMRNGAAAAMLVGVLCGTVGCFVVMRGTALLAESVAHGVLPGVAVAVLLTAGTSGDPDKGAILVGALAGGVVTAVGSAAILRRTRLREDTATAVMFVFMLALGVVLISRVEGFAVDLTSFLFGDVLSVPDWEVALTAGLAVAVLAVVWALYRPFVLVSFDRRRAASLGVPVDRIELALMVLLAVAVVIGFTVVGALLVLGLLIAPPAAAALLTKRLPAMMAVSAAIAAASGPLGLLVSWHFEVAAGASIVLVAVGAFAVTAVLRPAR